MLKTLKQIEKEAIVNTLNELGGNKVKAAEVLGISVKTIYNKLHEYAKEITDTEVQLEQEDTEATSSENTVKETTVSANTQSVW